MDATHQFAVRKNLSEDVSHKYAFRCLYNNVKQETEERQ